MSAAALDDSPGGQAAQLLAHLDLARWFGGKGRAVRLVGVTPLPWLSDTAAFLDEGLGFALRTEIVEVAYPAATGAVEGPGIPEEPDDDRESPAPEAPDGPAETGPREFYQLAVSYRRAPEPELAHAEIGRWTDPELGAVVAYDAMQDPAACSAWLGCLLAGTEVASEVGEVHFRLVHDEGLSTALEPAVFRGQQSNTSVMFGDVAMVKLFRRLELGRNLDIEVHDALGRSETSDVAVLFGWAEAGWRPAGATAPVRADLAMVVEKLKDAEDGWGLALAALEAGDDFAEHAAALGQALAATHAALREAFPTATADGAEVAAVMASRAAVATGIAPALAPYADGLDATFAALAGRPVDTQRVHGDFHLGQTLHTPGGWKIIDFEGEPVKTLAERQEPDSVWRDIGGMLRSFGYAAASVPGPESRRWADGCRAAFLAGYAGSDGLSAAEQDQLRAYEADKAVYEVVYEVRNRPAWVAIPLGAVATLVDTSTRTER